MADPESQETPRTDWRSTTNGMPDHGPEPLSQESTYDHDVHLRPEFVAEVREALHDDHRESALALVRDLHIADLADLFEVLPSEERRTLAALIADGVDARFLSELESGAFEDVLDGVTPEVIARAVSALESDDAIHILEHMDESGQRAVLRALTREDRLAVEEGLSFPEESAGRLMQRDLIAVPEFWSIGQTIDYLRSHDDSELPDDFYELVVIDPAYRPVGAVSLSRVLRSERTTRIREVMNRAPHLIHVATDQEDVARQFAKYHLISAAVVNDFGRLVGVITVDDIVNVIEEEAQEDIFALVGVREGDIGERLLDVARTRLLWLVVNLGTAIVAAAVISRFEASIEKIVALAVLMPIVASLGGNAGNQAMAVAVRALATKELGRANARRVIAKEMGVAMLNGLILAMLLAGVALLWFGNSLLAGVLGVAMVINMLVAGLGGILVPLGLERFGVDPAVASSVFVTTLTDVFGFLVFLGLATIVLL